MPGQWLFKTEPGTFSWDDLVAAPGRTTAWEGVRNYQARNFLRDRVKKGDGVLIYHSSIPVPAVMGTAVVVREGYPDPTQFDPGSPYHDPSSPAENPRWYRVDVQGDRKFPEPVPLPRLRETQSLAGMPLLNRSRLSIQPVSAREWKVILGMGGLAG
jgi:predicted RNA-binding protein with PUA-like domain